MALEAARELTQLERLELALRQAYERTSAALKDAEDISSHLFGPYPPTANAGDTPAPMGAIPALAQYADGLVDRLGALTSQLRMLREMTGTIPSPEPPLAQNEVQARSGRLPYQSGGLR